MATKSGKDGTVDFNAQTILDATSWEATMSSNNPSYGSTDTSGSKTRVGGVKDSTGTFSAKYNGALLVTEGTTGSGVYTVDGAATYTIPGIIEDYTLSVDMDDGEVVSYDMNWGATAPVVIS